MSELESEVVRLTHEVVRLTHERDAERQACAELVATSPDGPRLAALIRGRGVGEPIVEREVVYWSCDDACESLTHEDRDEALVEYVDGFLEPGCDTEKILREKLAPLTIYGYARAVIDDKLLADLSETAVERISEELEEGELADHLSGYHSIIDVEGDKFLKGLVLDALKKARAAGHIVPWSCEVIKEVVLEEDALVELVRSLNPEWFADLRAQEWPR